MRQESTLDHIEDICSFVTRNELEVASIIFSHPITANDDIDDMDEELNRQLLSVGTFAIIDLYHDTNESVHKYYEIYDLLKNHVWSNVTVLKDSSSASM